MAEALSDWERRRLLSSMSDGSCAAVIGRTEDWVKQQRRPAPAHVTPPIRKPAFHTGGGPGFERPAVMPPDPAVVAGGQWEADFVRRKRAARVSWANIARMTGKSEVALRQRYGHLK